MKKYFFLGLFLLTNSLSAQSMLTFTSEIIPFTDTTLIFVPEDYSPSDSYPLVFLLHGWDGNFNQWNEITGGLQRISDQYNFILCCPDGFIDSWYVDSPVKSDYQFEKFFFSLLVPALKEKYSIDPANVFITGLSMGGHGALTLFLKHQDFFNSAASTSGILDLTEFTQNWNIAGRLGSFQSDNGSWKSSSTFYLLDSLKDKGKEFWFDCGREDFAYRVNEKTFERCKELNIRASFLSQPGNHSREYWKKSINYHMEFFKTKLKK